MNTRGKRREKIGTVMSDKMDKTITVSIMRRVKHPQYEKYVKSYTKVKAHDEKNEARTGDRVQIMETRPLSKEKNWRLLKILERKEV